MFEAQPIAERAMAALKILRDMRTHAFVIRATMVKNPIYVMTDENSTDLMAFWNRANQKIPEMYNAVFDEQVKQRINRKTKNALFSLATRDIAVAEDMVTKAYTDADAGVIDQHSDRITELRVLTALLHPSVAEASLGFYCDQHYRVAVQKACDALTLLLRRKSDSEHDGEVLANQSLSPNNPKIVLAIGASKTADSIRSGYHALARGVFAGIRNPYTHEPDMIEDAVVAARHLVTISNVYARIDAKPWSKAPQAWSSTEGPELPL